MASETAPLHPSRSARRIATDRLREAVLALAEQRGQALVHREKAWASITFAGTRPTLSLRFVGADAVAPGERFVATLSEYEFAIPGQLVADANVSEVERCLLPEPLLLVARELLLLEEA